MINRKIRFAIHVTGITLLAFLLSHFLLYDIFSLSILSPLEQTNDFEMTDLYNSVLNQRAIKQKSDVIVIGIDGLSRSEVGDLIELIGANQPQAVGVDVLFLSPNMDDDLLLAQIESCPNLVLANKMCYTSHDHLFAKEHGSYFEGNAEGLHYGAANLAADNNRDIVRVFKPFYETKAGTVPSLAMAMANYINTPYPIEDEEQIIYYPSTHIAIFNGREVLNGKHLQELEQGIILIGDTANMNDTYLTPLNGATPGVIIHAYILNTILTHKMITLTSKWVGWLIAVLMCLLFASCNVLANWRMGNVGNFFLRVVQMGTVIVMFVIGLIWFVHYNQYIDFSAAIMMTAMGMLAADLWFGIYAGYRVIRNGFKKNKK